MTSLINFEQSPKRSLDLCANAYCNCRPPQGQTSTRNPQPQPHCQFKVYPHHPPQPINFGDGELIHMYYGGLCISWSRGSLSLSILLARALSVATGRPGRQAGNNNSSSLCLCPPRCSSLFRFVRFTVVAYVHTMAGHKICAFLIQVYTRLFMCVCVRVCMYSCTYLCGFVYLSVCVRSCDLF